MAMRELLRIEMSATQVREACEQWARDRASRDMPPADACVTLGPHPGGAIVAFTNRRAPRSKHTVANTAISGGGGAISDLPQLPEKPF